MRVNFILTGNGNPSNFDLARPAFEELFGQDGIAAGNGSAEWEVESAGLSVRVTWDLSGEQMQTWIFVKNKDSLVVASSNIHYYKYKAAFLPSIPYSYHEKITFFNSPFLLLFAS